jgi:hypothetical protein
MLDNKMKKQNILLKVMISLISLISFTLFSCEKQLLVSFQNFEVLNKSNHIIKEIRIVVSKNDENKTVLKEVVQIKDLLPNEKTTLKLDLKYIKNSGEGLFIPFVLTDKAGKLTLEKGQTGFYMTGASGFAFTIPFDVLETHIQTNEEQLEQNKRAFRNGK